MKKRWWDEIYFARCYNPKAYSTDLNLVTGEVTITANRCFNERLGSGACKPEALLFEPKP